jgi:hypothetical protein
MSRQRVRLQALVRENFVDGFRSQKNGVRLHGRLILGLEITLALADAKLVAWVCRTAA